MQEIYRRNYKGEIKIVGHLSPEGYEYPYATILDPNESLEEQRESHRNRFCKNKLGFYENIEIIKEQLKVNNFLRDLSKK